MVCDGLLFDAQATQVQCHAAKRYVGFVACVFLYFGSSHAWYDSIQGGPKSMPLLLIYWYIVLKRADKFTFLLKLSVKQATEVKVNKHLLVLNILSIKYSVYDVKCDVNYCVHIIALVDDRRIRVSATENHRIFNTTSSANNFI